MPAYNLSLQFEKGYIAHPYWPERERLINIQKESGINRVRSEAKRVQVLKDYLAAHRMEAADYEALEVKAERQFYRWSDILNPEEMDGRRPDEIVIPAHQMHGCLAQSASMASASIRIAAAEQIRVTIQCSDFATGKYERDAGWERFVVVTAGTGALLSNQRALRSNDYIRAFTARGRVTFLSSTDPDKVLRFLEFAGREIGVGASRKLGWGRFEVANWANG